MHISSNCAIWFRTLLFRFFLFFLTSEWEMWDPGQGGWKYVQPILLRWCRIGPNWKRLIYSLTMGLHILNRFLNFWLSNNLVFICIYSLFNLEQITKDIAVMIRSSPLGFTSPCAVFLILINLSMIRMVGAGCAQLSAYIYSLLSGLNWGRQPKDTRARYQPCRFPEFFKPTDCLS